MEFKWIESAELQWVLGITRAQMQYYLDREALPPPNILGRPLRWTEARLKEWAENNGFKGLKSEEVVARIERVPAIRAAREAALAAAQA